MITLRRAGKRVTAPKRTVAEVLAASPRHLTADQLTQAVQRRRPEVSPSTVYRILEELEDLDIVEHTHLGQTAAVYHLTGPVHGHLICERCAATFQISAEEFNALAAALERDHGFALNRHHVALSGLCERCRRSASGS